MKIELIVILTLLPVAIVTLSIIKILIKYRKENQVKARRSKFKVIDGEKAS